MESEVGYFRRNQWVPIPHARDFDDLNRQLRMACRQDQERPVGDREQSVGVGMATERDFLLPLAEESFDLAEISFPTVDSKRRVRVRTNWYSVPVEPGTEVEAKVLAGSIELWHQGRRVACHERCYHRRQEILDLEHYLPVLERKPGALAGSKPLEQWRKQGRWPASYDQFWKRLMERKGKQAGTREMIELLLLGQNQGWKRLQAAVQRAIDLSCWDGAAVRYLLQAKERSSSPPEPLEVGSLACYERPLPLLTPYDQLLGTEVQG